MSVRSLQNVENYKVDININTTTQGASGYTLPNRELPPCATRVGRDVRVHSDSLQSVGEHRVSYQGNAQSQNTDLSVYGVLPVVRDGVTGCVVTGCRNSQHYLDLLKKIKEQLTKSVTEESLKEIDRLYNRILNECDYSTEEIVELESYKVKIAAHYFNHLENQKNALVKELKHCFSLTSTGGADALFEQFINDVKRLHSDFSTVMQEILFDVGLTILSSQFDHNRVSHLVEQLSQNNSASSSHVELNHAQKGELRECAHTARQIVRRDGNHKPVVLENYLDRLTTILGRHLELAESNRQLHLKALDLITTQMTGKIKMGAGSDPEIFWHHMFFSAVLDVRFTSEFMILYQDIISEKPPENWGVEELLGFITVVRSSGKNLGYCSAEFLTLLTRMDIHDNEQPTSMPASASYGSEYDDDRAVEHDDKDFLPEVFTEEDQRRELDIFLQVVALEKSGEFYHGNYDKHYSDWHVLVEMILGKRALASPDARRAIKLLVNLSQGGVKTSNLHFVDTTGNATEAYKELSVAIKKISEKKTRQYNYSANWPLYQGNCLSLEKWSGIS